ncbi:ATP-binding protein [Pseudomaricurvus sp.]|uniref:ATP-binding protein n=1 Tax=Pseudomaricurvus sp. TaxID=2004510 RepID=UPI003F6AF99B
MRLRRQLVLVSLLTLSLPWAGCQYIQEMESALRQGQVVALSATAQAVANRIASEPELLASVSGERWWEDPDEQLYVHRITAPMQLDGYDDDWRALAITPRYFSAEAEVGETLPTATPAESPVNVSLRLARKGNALLLFANVQDAHIQYHNPSIGQLASGDHLRLRTRLPNGERRDYVIRSGAPGDTLTFYRDNHQRIRQEHRIVGQWQEHAQGFQMEVQLPVSLIGEQLGVALVNARSTPLQPQWIGNIEADSEPPYWSGQSSALTRAVSVFTRDDLRLRVVSANQWLLADAGSLQPEVSYDPSAPEQNSDREDEQHGLIRWLYRVALGGEYLPPMGSYRATGHFSSAEIIRAQQGVNAQGWYQWGSQRVGRAAVPIVAPGGQIEAVVVAEQSSDKMLALTNSAFNRLFFYTLLATAITGLGLLSYASWLSFRIRRLSRAAESAIDDSGRIRDSFPQSRAADEVGDLTRSYGDLLSRLREYTEYLRTLSGKLSHELRTPLAVVRSSLDNLEHEALSEPARRFSQRAQDGSARLSNILNAMSSANRVEESIRHADFENFSLSSLVTSLGVAYNDMTPDKSVSVSVEPAAENATLYGSPDLLVQMMDKLVENAIDFCPVDGRIVLQLTATDRDWVLSIGNDGPLLPERMQGQLFDSLVSLRPPEHSQDTTHLGLGLHIVRLIVEFHEGHVIARNRSDLSGVEFEIYLPKRVHRER